MHADFRCEDCDINDVPLEAHHKHYGSLGREKMSDLACLCRGCHQSRHDAIDAQKRDAHITIKSDEVIRQWARTGE